MNHLRIILLTGIVLSTVFSHMPARTTVIGGWGFYEIDDDYKMLIVMPEVNYFLKNNLSLDFDLYLRKYYDGSDTNTFKQYDIACSYYFYRNFYLKGGLFIEGGSVDDNYSGLRFGVGYPIRLSKNVFFDINYNWINLEDYTLSTLLYSFKVVL